MSEEPVINLGYALGQLHRALASSLHHPDAATRARAQAKIDRWTRVIEGMAAGALAAGSRTPVRDVPAWATLEVVTGGFATGGLLAGGPLLPHEIERLATIPHDAGSERAGLNAWYLGEEGQAELLHALATGAFRVRVPEEGALPVVAWLLTNGHAEAAFAILEAIAPFFDRLRFYPELAPDARPPGAVVRLRTVGDTVRAVDAVEPHARVARMNDSIRRWIPLEDRVVALFLETVVGETPRLATDASGALARRENGQPVVIGGMPGLVWPDGWRARAAALRMDWVAACASGTPPERHGFELFRYLVAAEGGALPDRDARRIRGILAGVVTRRGIGTARHDAVRAEQARVASLPTRVQLAAIVSKRLRALPADRGLPALEPILGAVTAEESLAGVPAGTAIPASLTTKVTRALEAPVEELLDRGVIPSAETLAIVLPQITAAAQAAGIADPALRSVFTAIYAAFRQRRSLLLLNLEHQVQLDELPWVAALAPFRARDLGAAEAARQTLEQAATLALTHFPETILPNKLLTELAALARTAALDLPLVEEVASDIFMGEFSLKFLRSAQIAARLLRGTLYARYYDLPIDAVLALDDGVKKWGTTTSPGFRDLCVVRAAPPTGQGSRVARNGTIIEQAMVLTTHNLAALFSAFPLADALREALPGMARRCLDTIVAQQRMRVDDWRARLQMTKNTAYAWRQMVFFLSFLDEERLWAFLAEIDEITAGVPRLGPAVAGLRAVAEGRSIPADAHRFYGWSVGTHWMWAAEGV
jgi:hypothetical protein